MKIKVKLLVFAASAALLASSNMVNAQNAESYYLKGGDTIYLIVDEQPEFLLDTSQMAFIMRNYKYPKEAQEAGIEGKVLVHFAIEPDGAVSHVSIMKDLGYGCGEEFARVIKMMTKWKPGKINGKPVRCHRCITISLKL